jgi:transcriptional regulator with XRE-family HTH domain
MNPLHTKQYSDLIKWLVESRKAHGLKQTDVAERLKKPQSFVSKYENCERRLDILEFIEVVKAIEVDPLPKFKELLKDCQITQKKRKT